MSQSELYPLHGGQLRQIAERFGIARAQLLDFSANINPDGPPASVLAAIREGLDDLSMLTDYPDLEEAELKQSIARYAKVRPQNIIVANGFVPLLEAVLRTLKVRRCVLPVPSFVEYRKTLESAGIEVSLHPLKAESCFSYDPAAMLDGEHDAILLANPQNPSGVCHDASRVRELIGVASKKSMYVLLDEAFIDYLPEQSLTTATDEFLNLIAFRSVTKFHGIPGLRVAYAATNPALCSSINENLPPWPITTLASRAVGAALGDRFYTAHSRMDNEQRRTTLQRDLQALGLVVYPSAANFLLFRLPQGIDPNALWQRMIVHHRIVVRACANYEALAEGHFRVAVRANEDNRRLVKALAESLVALAL